VASEGGEEEGMKKYVFHFLEAGEGATGVVIPET